MAYVPVPKDMNAVKTKVAFNLTKRQIVCFGGGLLVGLPVFFLIKGHVSSSTATLLMVLVMLPFFMFAMYEKNGQPLEKIIRNIVQVSFIRPKERPYKTNNFYSAVVRQEKLDKEVQPSRREKGRPVQLPEQAVWPLRCCRRHLGEKARADCLERDPNTVCPVRGF